MCSSVTEGIRQFVMLQRVANIKEVWFEILTYLSKRKGIDLASYYFSQHVISRAIGLIERDYYAHLNNAANDESDDELSWLKEFDRHSEVVSAFKKFCGEKGLAHSLAITDDGIQS